jgi:hypothetical protein
MTITIELPDSPVLEASPRFKAYDDGYRSSEDWCAMNIMCALQSEEPFGSKLYLLCEQWDDDLRQRCEQAA